MEKTLSYTKTPNFYENLIVRLHDKMDKGCLTISLPDGETRVFGGKDNGIRANITINNNEFYKKMILYGDVGFGEAYMEGMWDTDDITKVVRWAILNIDNAPEISGSKTNTILLNLLKFYNKLFHSKRENTIDGSRKNISEHYDLNNEFFAKFLDPTMTYSSAYFAHQEMDLETAQYAKYERLCKQMHLSPADHVLEIGSGWGANAIYMAKNYGCKVTSLTISEEQLKLARERVEAAGLSDKVTFLLKDYRLMTGSFDKIVSIEMLEAVGHKYLPVYFKKVQELLAPDGILALQVITCPDSRYKALRNGIDWIQKHIFPGSLLPSVAAINGAINKTGDLTMVDLKDMGQDYARTLKMWYDKFNEDISEIKSLGFDNTFIRKWNYYLCYCEAAFESRNINVMQMVYARPNNGNR